MNRNYLNSGGIESSSKYMLHELNPKAGSSFPSSFKSQYFGMKIVRLGKGEIFALKRKDRYEASWKMYKYT